LGQWFSYHLEGGSADGISGMTVGSLFAMFNISMVRKNWKRRGRDYQTGKVCDRSSAMK